MSDLVKRMRLFGADSNAADVQSVLMAEGITEIERLTAALATARNDALEEAARVSIGKSGTHNCEYRGIQDWETGEIPCDLENKCDVCECAVRSELAFEIADAILALKGGA